MLTLQILLDFDPSGKYVLYGILALAVVIAAMITANLLTKEDTQAQMNSKAIVGIYDNLISARNRVKHCQNLLLRIKGNEISPQMQRLQNLEVKIETEIYQMENDIDLELERLNAKIAIT